MSYYHKVLILLSVTGCSRLELMTCEFLERSSQFRLMMRSIIRVRQDQKIPNRNRRIAASSGLRELMLL